MMFLNVQLSLDKTYASIMPVRSSRDDVLVLVLHRALLAGEGTEP